MRASEHLPPRWNAAEHFIAHSAARRGAAPAIVTDEGVTTYAELDAAVRRAAAALADAGLHPGDRVVLLLTDGPLLATLFWGVLAAGGVAVPLNPLLRAADIHTILADCAPWLVVSAEPAYRGMLAWTPDEASRRISRATPAAAFAPTHRDGFAFMLYSSGTTGEPKGVLHLHHDMWVCARTYGQKVLGITADDRCFSVAKLPFAYGLGNAGYFPLDAGAAAVLFAGRPAPEAVFEQVRRHRPTLFFGVPTSYAQLLAAMDAGAAHDFSPIWQSVRRCVSAGESLPASLFERWKARTGLEILDGIGSTEICHIFLSGRPGACKPGSTGLAVPGYDLRLLDEHGDDVHRGDIGDLVVRGDSTMALYWNKAEATSRAISGDWIRTGDKYRVDEDGYYFHAGRSDDMLKVSGQWVSPVEVEAALIQHPAVLECAVVGNLDDDGLERPHAFVALRPNAEVTSEELIALARELLAAYKIPKKITIIAELPKTVTGKIQRYLLRDR